MSEQPKPLSAEEVVRDAFTNGVPGSADKAGWVALRAAVFKVLATLEAERARADAAEKSREAISVDALEERFWQKRAMSLQIESEDWQECAAHLALALKNAVHPSVYSAEVAMALAEFDRLADESTKGVEL